jgi:hypothetical protein
LDKALTIKNSLSILAAALMLLAAVASPNLQSTIVENGAPIAIDRCVVALANVGYSGGQSSFSEEVGFTNISQRTATQVRFGFEMLDMDGLTERTVTGDKLGKFAPGAAIGDSDGSGPDTEYMRQTVNATPHVSKALCKVQMVRFDDGGVWHDGDGPAGNGVMFTPPPGPSPSPQWQWPYDPPTP